MQITILNVTKEHKPNNKGGYYIADVAYKDDQGKVSGKKIMSFTVPAVYNALVEAVPGDVFDVVTEKDDKGYWQWKSVSKGQSGTGAKASGGAPSPKSTYETPEERAKKQIYIIRQSSIASAVAFSGNSKALKTPEEVIAVAKQFEDYVLDNNEGEVE